MPDITISIPDAAVPFLTAVVDRFNSQNEVNLTAGQFITWTLKRLMRDEEIRKFSEGERVINKAAMDKLGTDATRRQRDEETRLDGIIGP